MKKKLFLGLLAAAAVTFTACQKDEVISEVPQDQAIGFGTYVGRDAQTKASVTNKASMENALYAGFGVFAYYTGNNSYANTFTHEFMDNQQVTWNTSWDYNPKKYWPGGTNKVSFFAYAPYTNVTSSPTENITAFGYDNAGKGNPTLSFTVEDNVTNQIDLLYADPVTNVSSGTVTLDFNHALSRIGFKVKTDRTDYMVAISRITLTGDFNTSGTLNLSNGTWYGENAETDTDTYVLTFDTDNYITDNNDGIQINASEGYVMVIPTTFEETSKLTVSVEYFYKYEVSSGAWSIPVEDTKSGSIATTFAQGKAYTLVMILDPLQPIEFTVTDVDGWDPANGLDTPVTTTLVP